MAKEKKEKKQGGNKLENALIPIANSLAKNHVLLAIRDGFLITTPIVIVASIFLVLMNFPINGYEEWVTSWAGPDWQTAMGRVTAVGFDCISLMAVFGIGYAYSREKKLENKVGGAITALVAFLIITPQHHEAYINEAGRAFGGFAFGNFGTAGMFLAMITALLSVEVFAWAIKKDLVIKLPDGVPPAVYESFAALIPSGLAMVIAFVIAIIFSHTSYGFAHAFIYEILQAPLVGLGRLAGFEVLYQFLSTLFWFFGINGPAVTNTIFGPIHKVLTQENFDAMQAGLPMKNVFTAGFSDFFCNFGGGGSTLGLVLLMSFTAKSERMKTLGRLSLPAGIFGINEPIIFGLPIVLNPVMAIPFILTPVANTIVAYLCTAAGIIPITNGAQLPWTTPIGFSGFLVTGTFMGSVVQFVLLAMDIAIYLPFFKSLDKQYLEEEKKLDGKKTDELDELSFDDLSLD